MIMTNRLSLKIKQLADAFSAKDELNGQYRLVVKQAYTPYTQGATKPISPLLYEGRAAIFTLEKTNGDGGAPSSAAMGALAERATLLFDYVHFYKSTEIQVSVIESSCNAKIDLGFLIDGSDSIKPADFYLAKEFIRTVSQRFDLERGTQQLAMTIFSGWFLRQKEEAGIAFKPVNSDGKTCPSNYFCNYDASPEPDEQNPGCTECVQKLSNTCPDGTYWLRSSNGLDYCACRNAKETWKTDFPPTFNAECKNSKSNPAPYSGCQAAPITFTTSGQSAGQGYQSPNDESGSYSIFPLSCTTCSCDGINWGGEPVTPVFGFDDFVNSQATEDTIMASQQPHGRTWTSLGLRQMREDVFVPEAGCRRDEADVRQVLVIITDGNANQGYHPGIEADAIRQVHTTPSGATKDPGVETYAIGVGETCNASASQTDSFDQNTNKDVCRGKIKQGELNKLAGSSARVFTPKSYTELGAYAAELEAKLCGECPTAQIPTDVDIEASGGTRVCYEPVCPNGDRPREVVITVIDEEGQSELYVSKSGSAGPLNFDLKNDEASIEKRLVVSGLQPDSDLSITVYAADEGVNRATLSISASMFTYIEDAEFVAKVSPYVQVGDVIIPQLGKVGGAKYKIISGDTNTFAVDANRGILTVAGWIQPGKEYSVVVNAAIPGNPCYDGDLTVTIQVSTETTSKMTTVNLNVCSEEDQKKCGENSCEPNVEAPEGVVCKDGPTLTVCTEGQQAKCGTTKCEVDGKGKLTSTCGKETVATTTTTTTTTTAAETVATTTSTTTTTTAAATPTATAPGLTATAQPPSSNSSNETNSGSTIPIVAAIVIVVLCAAVCGWWYFAGRHRCGNARGNHGGELDGLRNETIGMMDNPMRAAAAAAAATAAAASSPNSVANLDESSPTRSMQARAAAQVPPVLLPSLGAATTAVYSSAVAGEARYSGYAPPAMEQNASAGGTASSAIIYAAPFEDAEDGASAIARIPNPVPQPAAMLVSTVQNPTFHFGPAANESETSTDSLQHDAEEYAPASIPGSTTVVYATYAGGGISTTHNHEYAKPTYATATAAAASLGRTAEGNYSSYQAV